MYVRFIILSEDIQNYFSTLILWALLTAFLASNMVIAFQKNINEDKYVVKVFIYYCLLLDYSIMILMTYFISRVNAKINSFRFLIEDTISHANHSTSFHFRLYMATIYQRMINIKPWGIKIGSITVLTTWVFFKLIIIYARFTLLTFKLSIKN
ncbi:uncharacterized protein LOC113797672 [Dermatophagoides pteronyssinus]